uniref:SGNH domain-containing protein n=1 Tax=Meloidogyne floridensis TaxID=298350 RepID=A0A915NMS5_9BILA
MKRDDIQGLRTLAIFGVTLSHIWPNYFPNGGLGVEMFIFCHIRFSRLLLIESEFNRRKIDTYWSLAYALHIKIGFYEDLGFYAAELIEENIDVNKTRLIIDEIVNAGRDSNFANNLTLYEIIRINENMQKATFDDKNTKYPNEINTNKWKEKIAEIIENKNELFLINFTKEIINFDGLGKNTTFLLIGNSHAEIISRSLQQVFKEKYSDFYTFTAPTCLPFYVPDHLAFIKPGKRVSTAYCAAYAKIVLEFIETPNLEFKYKTAKIATRLLWRGSPLDILNVSLKEHLKLNKWSYERLKYLNCPKCIIYDFSQHFCNSTTDICKAYDEKTKLVFFYDNNHLSYFGSKVIEPYLQSLLKGE